MVNTDLFGCKRISERARHELKEASCPVHDEVPGVEAGVSIVEIRYSDEDGDYQGYSVFGVQQEIKIISSGLHLYYCWVDELGGYELTTFEDEQEWRLAQPSVALSDLEDDRPF